MLLTLIAYRPNGEDVCRGHCVGRSDSDLEISYTKDINEAITIVSNYLFEDKIKDYEYSSYEITILQDGRVDDYDDTEFSYDDKLSYDILNKAAILADEKLVEHKRSFEDEKQKAQQRANEAKAKQELEMLAKLKQKYE